MTKKMPVPCEGLDLFTAVGMLDQTAPGSGDRKPQPKAVRPSRQARGKTIKPHVGKERGSENYLRDTDVAKRYDVARQTVWRWAAQGKLPEPIKLSEGVTRWRLSDLCAYEASRPKAKSGRLRRWTSSKGRGQP